MKFVCVWALLLVVLQPCFRTSIVIEETATLTNPNDASY